MNNQYSNEIYLTVNKKLMNHLHSLENKINNISNTKNEANNTIEYCANRLIEMTKEKVELILQIQDLKYELNTLNPISRGRRNSF